MKRFLLSALLFCCAAFPARGDAVHVKHVYSNAPADSVLYRLVRSAFNEARLTARLEMSAYQWAHEIPLLEGTSHEGQLLSPRLSPTTIYLGGLEAGAEYRRALRFFGWYRFNMGNKNLGLLPSGQTRVRLKNGSAAVGDLASPEYSAYGAHVEYTPTVWRGLAIGGGVSYHHRGESLVSAGNGDYGGIRTESTTNFFSLYVPARYQFEWGAIHAKVGTSLFGNHESEYFLGIAYSNPPEPGNLETPLWTFEDANPRAWSAEAGAAVPLYGFMVHAGLHVKRLWVEGGYTETIGGLKLQIGLPF